MAQDPARSNRSTAAGWLVAVALSTAAALLPLRRGGGVQWLWVVFACAFGVLGLVALRRARGVDR